MSGKKDVQIELLSEILASLRRIEAQLWPVRIGVSPNTTGTGGGTWLNPGITVTSKAGEPE